MQDEPDYEAIEAAVMERYSDYPDLPRHRFLNWFLQLSIPRAISSVLGNSKEYEERIKQLEAAHRREVDQLRGEIDWLRSCFRDLSDSVLLSKGMKPTSLPLTAPVNNGNTTVVSSADRYAIDAEVDKIKEMFYYRPAEVDGYIADLEARNRPRDREVLRRLKIWLDATAPRGDRSGPNSPIGIQVETREIA